MSPTAGLLPSLAAVAGILAVAAAAGWFGAASLVPGDRANRSERKAWAFGLGLACLALSVCVALVLGLRPGWLPFALTAAAVAALARFRAPGGAVLSTPERSRDGALILRLGLAFLIAAGVALYLLRALTEPMWATDFLAIWGWKGKTICLSGRLPDWMWRTPELGYTHPEYPLGLPLLYAGVGFLLGRWDDHAMALLFPATQAATLLFLAGWLRRRGASRAVALSAAGALALFEPLYRAFTTGMAEVPLSFFLLLLGASLCDALDGEPGALRRLAAAALGAAALKNEGLLAAAAAAGIALAAKRTPGRSKTRIAAAAVLPAIAVFLLHRLRTGPLPLRDFRFGLLFEREILIRLGFDLRAIFLEAIVPAAAGLAALAALLLAGRPDRSARRLLALAGILLAAYALLPAFAVLGPDWLVRTAFARTSAALAPIVFAAAALRLAPLFPEGDA